MNSLLRFLCCGVLGMTLASVAGCESTGSSSVGVSYGYGYGGYYPAYYGNPGYWYDDDRPIVVQPPENRPGRPTTLPAQGPSTRPSVPATRPSASTRPARSMSRPASRPMPARRRP